MERLSLNFQVLGIRVTSQKLFQPFWKQLRSLRLIFSRSISRSISRAARCSSRILVKPFFSAISVLFSVSKGNLAFFFVTLLTGFHLFFACFFSKYAKNEK